MIDNVEIKIDKDFSDGEISPLLFGSFAEHMGRCIYGGIYDETKGVWREDVLSLVRELKVPIVRYPGGNFVSGYCWKDGIGPKEKRPKKLNLAWRQLEPNEVGVLEFADWAERAGTEIMMCVNLGTGTAQEAAELVEYCNAVPGSYWSDRRVEDGRKEPLKIRYWCLGNEMDGDWQICHMTAEEYARKAVEAAKLMKRVDPSIRLIACGSSAHAMKTCPEWDRIVLEHLYDFVDFISLHQYYGRHTGTNDDFFASYLDFERYIDDIAATCDYVRAVKQSDKTLKLSFDEWNVLTQGEKGANDDTLWQVRAARAENRYSVCDALVVGQLLTSLMNKCGRVGIACLAQLVNVLGPVRTEGENSFRQTIFYPFAMASNSMRGRVLRQMKSGVPVRHSEVYGDAETLHGCVAYDEEQKKLRLYYVNSSDRDIRVKFNFGGFSSVYPVSREEFGSKDLEAKNTAEAPDTVRLFKRKEKESENIIFRAQTVTLLTLEAK